MPALDIAPMHHETRETAEAVRASLQEKQAKQRAKELEALLGRMKELDPAKLREMQQALPTHGRALLEWFQGLELDVSNQALKSLEMFLDGRYQPSGQMDAKGRPVYELRAGVTKSATVVQSDRAPDMVMSAGANPCGYSPTEAKPLIPTGTGNRIVTKDQPKPTRKRLGIFSAKD